jgi:vacuolar-type H+-ATPase subunit C/Vma6
VNSWGPLLTRARGLSGHLLSRVTLRTLAAADDRRALSDALARIGYLAFPPNAPPPDDRAIEHAIRRVAARRFDLLERWSRDCDDVLAPVIEDEDRRSIRAVVRGALGTVPPAWRTAGLIPTAALPARALDELALLNDVGAIGAALLALRHPFARVLADQARRERPDLFSLEQAVVRAWAARAGRAARKGDRSLRHYVERQVDLVNACAARLVAEQRSDAEPEALFVPGGTVVTMDDLRFAAAAANVEAIRDRLRPRVRGTPLAVAVAPGTRAPDDAALTALIAEYRTLARREPLGLAPVLLYVMRLRSEHRALQRMLWQLSLGVPTAARLRDLEEAA